MLRTLAFAVAFCLSSVACSSQKPPATTPTTAAGGIEMAKAPFTSAELRQAARVGRTYEFRVEAVGQPTKKKVLRFLAVSDEGADLESTVYDDAGKVLEPPNYAHAAWDELRKHGEFPAAQLTVEELPSLDTAAGKLACTLYTVTKGDDVMKYTFARALPGPPVVFSTDKAGVRVMTSTLVRFEPGK